MYTKRALISEEGLWTTNQSSFLGYRSNKISLPAQEGLFYWYDHLTHHWRMEDIPDGRVLYLVLTFLVDVQIDIP